MFTQLVRSESRDTVLAVSPITDQGACRMTGIPNRALICALLLSILLAVPSTLFPGAVDAQEATPAASGSGRAPVLLFAAPGMRPDIVETFAAEGALPAMA